MSNWSGDELSKLGDAEEVQIASVGRDGTLRKPVTTWVIRHGDDLYVRSVSGRSGQWFRGAQEKHKGRIRAGRVQKDVTFVDADDAIGALIDAAYRNKYRRYTGSILNSVLTPAARAATLKIVPRPT
jgi:hypothetical protein